MKIEKIKDCPGYWITADGRVWSDKHNKWLKLYDKGKGYLYAILSVDGKSVNKRVNRLVAEAFIPNPQNLPICDHINRDRADNRVENLRWVSQKENCQNRKHTNEYWAKRITKTLFGGDVK